jgi:sec-independent protein translocase protein TatB
MFGLGWSELLVVGIVALIVIGPKDLPGLFRTMGQFTGKARMMAREFSRAMEQAADDAGVKDISKTLNAAANPKKFGVDKLKEATGTTKAPETTLSPERQAAKEKMSKAMGDAAVARKAREAEDAAAKAATDTPAPATPTPEAKS